MAISKVLLAGAFALTASAAQATTVNFSKTDGETFFTGDGRNVTITVGSNGHDDGFTAAVKAGAFAVTNAMTDYLAFCIDLYDYYSLADAFDASGSFSHDADNPSLTAGIQENIAKLYATSFQDVLNAPRKRRDAAAFQIAIWEIVQDSDKGAFDLDSGDFILAKPQANDNDSNPNNRAQEFLARLAGADGSGVSLAFYTNPDQQNLVIGDPDGGPLPGVPLPAGGLLLIGGLAALAGLRRRKG